MPGLLSDDGYIYQRKVVIYYILKHLLRKDLAECRIELNCFANSDEDEIYSYSIDFFIRTNANKYKYFEVKKKQSLYYKSSLQPIIDNFNQKYISFPDENSEFNLIYDCQIKGDYLPKFDLSRNNKIKAMKKINRNYSDVFCDKFYCKQIIDAVDSDLVSTDVELRSIGLIDKVLKEYNILKYGEAEKIYHSIKSCFENLESQEADKLKKKITDQLMLSPTLESSVIINLNALLDSNNSFFDKISPMFLDRTSAKNDFYSKFSIPDNALPSIQI